MNKWALHFFLLLDFLWCWFFLLSGHSIWLDWLVWLAFEYDLWIITNAHYIGKEINVGRKHNEEIMQMKQVIDLRMYLQDHHKICWASKLHIFICHSMSEWLWGNWNWLSYKMLKTKFSNTTSIIACTLHEFQNTYVPLVKEKKPSKTSTYKKGFLPKNMLIVKSIFV